MKYGAPDLPVDQQVHPASSFVHVVHAQRLEALPRSLVDFPAVDPIAQCLSGTAYFRCDRFNGGLLRHTLFLMLMHHPNSPLTFLGGENLDLFALTPSLNFWSHRESWGVSLLCTEMQGEVRLVMDRGCTQPEVADGRAVQAGNGFSSLPD